MTQPQIPPGQRPLFDTGNTRLTTDLTADLDIGKVAVPGGELGIATIRQGNTTLTIPLSREGAELWAGLLTQLRDMLSPSGKLVTAQAAPIIQAVAGQRL